MANIHHLSILRVGERKGTAMASIPASGTLRGLSVNSQGNLTNKGGKGFGKAARRRLSQCIEIFQWHMISVKVTPTFWSFTIPDDTRVRIADGYRVLLHEFLKKVERKWSIAAYIYCTENQTEKRTQTHWHIMFDRFIEMHDMKVLWCEHLRSRGYLDKWSKEHDYDPLQSVRVEPIATGVKLSSYLLKYMSKVSSKDDIEARFWGCSKWIKMAPGITLPMTAEGERNLIRAEAEDKISCLRIYRSNTGIIYSIRKGEVATPFSTYISAIYRYDKYKCYSFFCRDQMALFNRYLDCYARCDWEGANKIRDEVYEMVERYWQGVHNKTTSVSYSKSIDI